MLGHITQFMFVPISLCSKQLLCVVFVSHTDTAVTLHRSNDVATC